MSDGQLISVMINLVAIIGGTVCVQIRLGKFGGQMGERFTDLSKRLDDVRDLLRADMRMQLGEFRNEMKHDIAGLKTDLAILRADIADLRLALSRPTSEA